MFNVFIDNVCGEPEVVDCGEGRSVWNMCIHLCEAMLCC